MSTRKQLGVGARKTIMARHQRMPTSKAGYTCAVEPTVVKQITCIEEESIYALVQCTTRFPLSRVVAEPGHDPTFFLTTYVAANILTSSPSSCLLIGVRLGEEMWDLIRR